MGSHGKSTVISAQAITPAVPGSGCCEVRKCVYTDPVRPYRREYRMRTGEADYWTEKQQRNSRDNGRTWSEWEAFPSPVSQRYGELEVVPPTDNRVLWNPVHRHWVHIGTERIFPIPHEEVYRRYWENGERLMSDHVYLTVRKEFDDPGTRQLVTYEPCPEFDPARPADPGYLDRGLARSASSSLVLDDGRLLFPVNPFVRKCCELANLDVQSIFPSCPDLVHGVMMAVGTFRPGTGRYEFTFSPPLLVPDVLSSRCLDEPVPAVLNSGKILLVMRGSNYRNPLWHTRISASAPSYRFYSLSEDGGKHFSPPVPWHFDDRAILYSPGSISHLIRSSKNGKLYWIGNVTGPDTYENNPRYPLCMAEVDGEEGVLKKDSLLEIDTRRPGESPRVQLSNFGLLEDRETGNFEVTLAKVDQFSPPDTHQWECEGWKYVISPE